MPSIDENPGYYDLANAIVYQAAQDYLDLIANLTPFRGKEKKLREESLLRFFHSDWYLLLTSLPPDLLIKELHQQAKEKYSLRYTVRQTKNGKWYACSVETPDIPLTKAWKTKDTALAHAAALQGLPRRAYNKVRTAAECARA